LAVDTTIKAIFSSTVKVFFSSSFPCASFWITPFPPATYYLLGLGLPFRDLLPPGVGSAFQRLITSWGTLPFSDLLPPGAPFLSATYYLLGLGFFFFLLPFRVWGWLCLSVTYYLLGHPSFQRLITSWGTLPSATYYLLGLGFSLGSGSPSHLLPDNPTGSATHPVEHLLLSGIEPGSGACGSSRLPPPLPLRFSSYIRASHVPRFFPAPASGSAASEAGLCACTWCWLRTCSRGSGSPDPASRANAETRIE
jgi:hypothetical protein